MLCVLYAGRNIITDVRAVMTEVMIGQRASGPGEGYVRARIKIVYKSTLIGRKCGNQSRHRF